MPRRVQWRCVSPVCATPSPFDADRGIYLEAEVSAIPSRDFMIRQAVLNATQLYEPDVFRCLGVSWGLSCMISGGYVRSDLCTVVRAEYSKIAAQYGVAQ